MKKNYKVRNNIRKDDDKKNEKIRFDSKLEDITKYVIFYKSGRNF